MTRSGVSYCQFVYKIMSQKITKRSVMSQKSMSRWTFCLIQGLILSRATKGLLYIDIFIITNLPGRILFFVTGLCKHERNVKIIIFLDRIKLKQIFNWFLKNNWFYTILSRKEISARDARRLNFDIIKRRLVCKPNTINVIMACDMA